MLLNKMNQNSKAILYICNSSSTSTDFDQPGTLRLAFHLVLNYMFTPFTTNNGTFTLTLMQHFPPSSLRPRTSSCVEKVLSSNI